MLIRWSNYHIVNRNAVLDIVNVKDITWFSTRKSPLEFLLQRIMSN